MQHRRLLAGAALALAAGAAQPAHAQFWNHPQFQPPRTAMRELNIGVASAGDQGTALVGQGRVGFTATTQLGFDLGFAVPDGGNVIFLGGNLAQQLLRATTDMPLDLAFTAGVGLAFVNPEGEGAENLTLFRVPLGAVAGYRVPLQGGAPGMGLTPYVHPRLSIEHCGKCINEDGEEGETDLTLDFDIGASFDLNRQLALRFAARVGGGDDSDPAFGFSLAFRPGAGTARSAAR